MHEEALLKDLRRKVEEVALAQGALKVSRVSIWVGALSHLTEEQLRARWPELMAGSVAEGSELEVDHSTDLDDSRAQGIILKSLNLIPQDEGGNR
jgi:hydrogenase nickel incorporation protein HypA/HybF